MIYRGCTSPINYELAENVNRSTNNSFKLYFNEINAKIYDFFFQLGVVFTPKKIKSLFGTEYQITSAIMFYDSSKKYFENSYKYLQRRNINRKEKNNRD